MIPRRLKIGYKSNLYPIILKINREMLLHLVSKLELSIKSLDLQLIKYDIPIKITKLYLEEVLVDYTEDILDYLSSCVKLTKKELNEIQKITNNRELKLIIHLYLEKQQLLHEKYYLETLDYYIYQETILLEPFMLETGAISYKEPKIDFLTKENLAMILNSSYITFPTLDSDILQNIDRSIPLKDNYNTLDIYKLKDVDLINRETNLRNIAEKNLKSYKLTSYFGREFKFNNTEFNSYKTKFKLNRYEIEITKWDYIHVLANVLRVLSEKNKISGEVLLIIDKTIFISNITEDDKIIIEKYLDIEGFRKKISYRFKNLTKS